MHKLYIAKLFLEQYNEVRMKWVDKMRLPNFSDLMKGV